MESKIDLELQLRIISELEKCYKEPFFIELKSEVYTAKSLHVTCWISKEFAEKVYGQDNS